MGWKVEHFETSCSGQGVQVVDDTTGRVICCNEPYYPTKLDPKHAHLIAAAPAMLEAIKLHVAYEALPQDRGGKNGPKGKAWAAFIAARDAVLATVETAA